MWPKPIIAQSNSPWVIMQTVKSHSSGYSAGKSLDKIMELKAIAGDQDLYDVMKKEKKKRRRRDARHTEAGPTKQTAKPKNVFDFINKKLSKKKGK